MTNDRTEAIETSPVPEPPVPSRHDRRRRSRLAAAAAAALVAALGLGAVLALADGTHDSAASGVRPATKAAAPVVTTTAPAGDQHAPDPSGDETADASPDPGPPPAPGHLVLSATHLVLMTNDFDGSFEITNDGGSDVTWTWDGNPTLAVSPSGGVLAPGESVVVEFTISWQQLSNGGFIYQSYVDTDDQSIKVTISGTRDVVVNPGIELPKPVLKPND